jgi:hypothetical protein
MLTAACCTTGCRRLNAQSTVVKMRRLARAYQAKLNFYLINRGELPDYEGAAGAAGDGRSVVVGAVSALRAKQPYDFTFDPHSELSVEKLKEWIDLFLAGKLKKVRSHRSSYAQLQLAHVAAVALRRARPSKSCRTATLSRLTTRSGPCISTTWQSGIKQWATWTLPCNRCVETTTSHTAYPAAAEVPLLAQLEEALELDPQSPILHYNMGQAREMIGEMEGAIAEYKLSLDNDIRYMDGAPYLRGRTSIHHTTHTWAEISFAPPSLPQRCLPACL